MAERGAAKKADWRVVAMAVLATEADPLGEAPEAAGSVVEMEEGASAAAMAEAALAEAAAVAGCTMHCHRRRADCGRSACRHPSR